MSKQFRIWVFAMTVSASAMPVTAAPAFPSIELQAAAVSESDVRGCGDLARQIWKEHEQSGLLDMGSLARTDNGPDSTSSDQPTQTTDDDRLPAFLRGDQ